MNPIGLPDILQDAQKHDYALAASNANGATYDIALEGRALSRPHNRIREWAATACRPPTRLNAAG